MQRPVKIPSTEMLPAFGPKRCLQEMPVYRLPIAVDQLTTGREYCPKCKGNLYQRNTHLVPSVTVEGYFIEYRMEGFLFCKRCRSVPFNKPAIPASVLVTVRPRKRS
jgi:hypothetical protein